MIWVLTFANVLCMACGGVINLIVIIYNLFSINNKNDFNRLQMAMHRPSAIFKASNYLCPFPIKLINIDK